MSHLNRLTTSQKHWRSKQMLDSVSRSDWWTTLSSCAPVFCIGYTGGMFHLETYRVITWLNKWPMIKKDKHHHRGLTSSTAISFVVIRIESAYCGRKQNEKLSWISISNLYPGKQLVVWNFFGTCRVSGWKWTCLTRAIEPNVTIICPD